MAVTHVTKVFAAKDCKLWPLTADTAPSTLTYGTGVDVPGLKSITITGDVNTVELRGDNTKLDASSSMGGITVSLEFAKLSLDVLSSIFAATTVDAGTDPNATATWTMLGTTGFSYVGLTAQAVGADPVVGDVMFSIYKLIPSSFPEMGLAEEDYKTNTVEFEAVPTISGTNKWLGVAVRSGTGAAVLAAPA
jgi:hypothetical protein